MTWRLQIRDMHERGHLLTVDLRHVLRALGREAVNATWTVSGVESNNEELFATGDGAAELEALATSGERIPGDRLLGISERTHQVIWGSFSASLDEGRSSWLSVTAYDSTWYEVRCDDRTVIDRVAACFKKTSIDFLEPPPASGTVAT